MNITDTLSASQIFEKAGFSSQQAKALAIQHEAMAQELVANIQKAFEPQFTLLETRLEAKITNLETKMVGQITHLEAKMEGKIESVSRDQLFKIFVLVLSSAGLTVALLSLAFAYFTR